MMMTSLMILLLMTVKMTLKVTLLMTKNLLKNGLQVMMNDYEYMKVLFTRALPDIMSGPEVRQIFKVWTVRQIGHMNFGIFEVFSVEI